MGKEKKKVYVYKANTKELVNTFESISLASKSMGIDVSNISKNCRKEIKSIGNYIFSYFKLENGDTRKSNNDVDRLYNAWIDKIYDQKLLLLSRDIKDANYENRLSQFENKVETIYHSVENEELCYEMLGELKYEFMTYEDYREIILKIDNSHMYKYKNEYLLLDKEY